MDFKPRKHQQQALEFLDKHLRCCLFMDMGLGKTATILQFIKDKGLRAMIIAPPAVAENTWTDENEKWGFGLSMVRLTSKRRKKELPLAAAAQIVITTPSLINDDDIKFDIVIVDEYSMFKHATSKRFKALKRLVGQIKGFVGLTGTPAPNGYENLYAQMLLVDGGKRLGKTLTAFRDRFCTSRPIFMGSRRIDKYEVTKNNAIERLVAEKCLSFKIGDVTDLTEPIKNDVYVDLEPSVIRLYAETQATKVLDDNVLEAAALASKLQQIANGNVITEGGTRHIHDSKLDELEVLIENTSGNILLFYQFKSDRDAIMGRYPFAKDIKDTPISEWNAGGIKLLIAHPASAGHGLNLQDGGSTIVWYGLTYNLELYLQANARLFRTGQKQQVVIHHLIARDTIEQRVLHVLEGKTTVQDFLLNTLKSKS